MIDIDANFFPLGLITPTPGTPSTIYANYPALADDEYSHVNIIFWQAHPDNTGRVYLGSPSMNVAANQGINYTLMSGGDSFSIASSVGSEFDIRSWRIDCENLGDGVYVSIYIR